MTYTEFLNNNIWRPIIGMKYHIISNKGEIKNTKTGNIITNRINPNHVTLWEDGKNKIKNIWYEVLKAFPDVEFTETEIRQFCHNQKIKRGVYRWNYNYLKVQKKWRAVISFQGNKKTIGYYKTEDEAYRAYYEAFIKLRNFRPW